MMMLMMMVPEARRQGVTFSVSQYLVSGIMKGCMSTMMMEKFILLANVLSIVPAARDRMARGTAG